MVTFLSIIQIILSIALIAVVLLHQRKQGGFAGVFGGGTQAETGQWQRFNALTKITVVIAVLFMLLSAVLVIMS